MSSITSDRSTDPRQDDGHGAQDDHHKAQMPLEVSSSVSGFDRFAKKASDLSSHAWFFTFCVLLVVVWAPSYWVFKNIDTWQLIINTCTTIVTFLMVALIQNSQTRSEQAVQHKLNAIAQGLSDLMEHIADVTDEPSKHLADDLDGDLAQLRAAVGLERYESSSDNNVND
ncbi:MAG: low affinity iron permease family protein [Intrasporangium sp.]|uniref:low affinity iron permease family protein n=1 Tax=Intrasporangium sp. TaxID=1925024 RepID=UPI003F7EF1DB